MAHKDPLVMLASVLWTGDRHVYYTGGGLDLHRWIVTRSPGYGALFSMLAAH